MKTVGKEIKFIVIALCLIIFGSLIAHAVNTNTGKVDVSEITYETERGTMSAYLYMPEGAGADNPRPVIVLAHGYLNNKQMQDATAVEMSRRGYIVMVVDQYDHGNSRWAADIPNGTEMGTFWVFSMSDAVNYVYNQDFTLKDEDGNAYIGCSGHSMGGLSTVCALFFDEMQALESGHRMIYTAIPESADFTFTDNVAPREAILAAYGDRTIGIIQGRYDEFFFGDTEGMYYKDFINHNEAGKDFLGLAEDERGESGTFYSVESGPVVMDGNVLRESQTGEHVVYQINEAHAQNHFSTTVEGHIIDFFTYAFGDVVTDDMTNWDLTSDNQAWTFKEFGNLIALIGFFMFIIPFVGLLTKAPVFKAAVTEYTEPVPKLAGAKQAVLVIVSLALAIIPAVLYVPLMDKVPEKIAVVRIVVIVAAVIMAVIGLCCLPKSKTDESGKFKSYVKGSFICAIIAAALAVVLSIYNAFTLNPFFTSTNTNWSVYWAFCLAFICAFMGVFMYYFFNKPAGVSLESYGLKVKPKVVGAALLTAAVTIAVSYIILFIIHSTLLVDFRIWTLAVKTFNGEHFATMLKYLPFYFVFYLALTVLVNANTRYMKKAAGMFASIISVAGGLLAWMIIQYGTFYIGGEAAWSHSGMISIGMLAILPCLVVATIYSRKLYEKTNNVWTASFVNAILFTLITVANAIIHWNLV